MISLIVAVSENGVIGDKNSLPWRLPEDLKRFAEITTGHSVVMGRVTYESIVNKIGRPLPNRLNIVLTRDKSLKAPGCEIINSPEEINKYESPEKEIFVIGGSQVYKIFLPRATKIYKTLVHAKIDGDTHFPEINENEWRQEKSAFAKKDDKNEFDTTFIVYERKK